VTKKWKTNDGRTVNVSSKKADIALKLIDGRVKLFDHEATDLASHGMFASAASKQAQATGLQLAFNYILDEFKPKRRKR
jgi:hypothetical protein